MAFRETARNPFLPPPSTAKKAGIFETRSRAGTPREIEIDRRFRESSRTADAGEHILTISDLHQELLDLGHPEACESVFRCDPWMVEPIVLEELMLESSKGTTADPARIERLRGLIRAGSWMSYDRTEPDDAYRQFAVIVKRELERRNAEVSRQAQDAERASDPELAHELRNAFEDEKALFERGLKAFRDGAAGKDAEPAARTIEYLFIRDYMALKQLAIRHPGLTLDDARRHPVGRPFAKEIEQLRPARDWAYFRSVYPGRARKSKV